MGIVVRQSVKATIVIFIGALLGAFLNLSNAFVFRNVELGYITHFVYVASLIQIFTLLGTGSLVSVYTQKYADSDPRQKTLLSFGFLTIVAASIVFSIGYFFAKDVIIGKYQLEDRPYIDRYYWCTPVLVLCWSFMSLFEHYLLAKQKIAIVALMRDVIVRVLNIIFLALYFFKLISFDYFVISIILSYLLPALALAFVSSRIKGFGFSLNFRLFSRKEYKDFIHFSWYHMLMIATVNFMSAIDVIMLGPLAKDGISSLAVYRIAAFIISLMIIPSRAINNASFAVLNRTYLEEDHNSVQKLFNRIGDNILIAGTGMVVLIACNLDNAIAILPANKGFEAIKPLVIILMLGRLIDLATGVNNELISITKYYKFSFRVSVLLVVLTVVLMRYLIPIYGMYGAAWGATLSFAVFNVIKAIYIKHKLNINSFTRATVPILLSGAAAAIGGFIIPYCFNPILDAMVRSIAIVIIFLILLVSFKASPDLTEYLNTLRKNKRLY